MKARRKTTPERPGGEAAQSGAGEHPAPTDAVDADMTSWGAVEDLLAGISAISASAQLMARQQDPSAAIGRGEIQRLLRESIETLPASISNLKGLYDFVPLLTRLALGGELEDSPGHRFAGDEEDAVWVEWCFHHSQDEVTDADARPVPCRVLDSWLQSWRSDLELLVDERLSHVEVRPPAKRTGRRGRLVRVPWSSFASSEKRMLGLVLEALRTAVPIRQDTIREVALGQDTTRPEPLRGRSAHKVKYALNRSLLGLLGELLEAEHSMQHYLISRVPCYLWIRPSRAESRLSGPAVH